jgi:hypothetical protein
MSKKLFITGDKALALSFLNKIMGVNMPGIMKAGMLKTGEYFPERETTINPDIFCVSETFVLSTDPLYCLEAEEVKFNTTTQQINPNLNIGTWLLNLRRKKQGYRPRRWLNVTSGYPQRRR